jgi:hypothetical protein
MGPAPKAGVEGAAVVTEDDAGCETCGVGGRVCREGDASAERRNFEGDLDNDRRRERTVAVTSTLWAWVGDGRVRVPPLALLNDMVVLGWEAPARQMGRTFRFSGQRQPEIVGCRHS